MHSLKNTKDYWRQVFNNISILGILDDGIEIVQNAHSSITIKVKKFICTFSRSAWEAGQTHYLCHLSLLR